MPFGMPLFIFSYLQEALPTIQCFCFTTRGDPDTAKYWAAVLHNVTKLGFPYQDFQAKALFLHDLKQDVQKNCWINCKLLQMCEYIEG